MEREFDLFSTPFTFDVECLSENYKWSNWTCCVIVFSGVRYASMLPTRCRRLDARPTRCQANLMPKYIVKLLNSCLLVVSALSLLGIESVALS